MCLVILDRRYKDGVIAKWDIPVWKVLRNDLDGSALFTPVMLVRVDRVPSEMTAVGPDIETGDLTEGYVVEGGAIHAYADTRGGVGFLRDNYSDDRIAGHYCLVRAVVPEGARYWVGDRNDIAATRLRLVEVVASNGDDGLPTIAEWCDGQGF